MKKKNKDRLKQRRIKEEEKKKKLEERIIKSISSEQINYIKTFNMEAISNGEVSSEQMIECLQNLFNIIKNSSYLDEIVRMTRENVSPTWFDREVDKDFINEILERELKIAKSCPKENIALKLCYFSNRIAHHIEKEVLKKYPKHKINDIYTKYYLNKNYHYDFDDSRDSSGRLNDEVSDKLHSILKLEIGSLSNIESVDELNEIFFGINIRNELWTLKQEMLKELLKSKEKNENSSIKVTALQEEQNLTINGSQTLRLIIREVSGIAPVIMHCDKGKVEDLLNRENLSKIPEEKDEKIIEFAKDGKVGIHFVLDKENRDILDYEADYNSNAKKLNEVIYRGDNSYER